jgi:hypothetical protein
MTGSLVDAILAAPENERAVVIAETVAALGNLHLEECDAIATEADARH